MSQHQSQEGYQWTDKNGLQRGLPTLGAIRPASKIQDSDDVYDVIVIGAGYAGLTAVRDLTLSGLKVLLLEARDRIGGRTFTATIDGHHFEMGGTYVHWTQPNIWREIARYSMQSSVEAVVDLEQGVTGVSVRSPAGLKTMTQDEQDACFAGAFQKFINVDGSMGRIIMPYPHNPTFNPDVANVDTLTLQDWLDKIKSSLTSMEQTLLETFLVVISGAKLEKAGLFDMIRLWALCGYSVEGLGAALSLFKLHDGQSFFARKMFDEALKTQKLSYALSCPIVSVEDHGEQVSVKAASGQCFRGRRVIITIPHNVMNGIKFNPSLSAAKTDILATHHVNQSTKIQAEVQPSELRTWDCGMYPDNKLAHAAGEAITPAGNARTVCFGGGYNPFQPEVDIQATLSAVKNLHERIEVKRLVFHNWVKDEYSQGGWSWLAPSMGTTRDVGVLRVPHGNVHFANADWAVGWRGFIDGAIEEGTRAAKLVNEGLKAV